MSAKTNAPVIIKRKKVVGGDGHHGGAWKVAYADFVTAMMAFFMLMWLLNATTEKQRKGIADYFNPTIPVNRISGGGDGAFGGPSVFSEDTLAQQGTGASAKTTPNSDKSKGDSGVSADGGAKQAEGEAKALREVEKMLAGKAGESMVSEQLQRHIVTRVTDEGLIVELFDLPGVPLFDQDGTAPSGVLRELTDVLARVFGLVANDLAVNGHVRSYPEVLAYNPEWDLSTGRAAALRDLLTESGLAPGRIQRVTGYSNRKPVTADPMASRNNRIELILLRRVAAGASRE